MKKILERLSDFENLTREKATEILIKISNEEFSTAEVSSFISLFNLKGISIEELSGFKQALLELCIPVNLDEFNPIDLCGTGGDGKNTFNISTLAAFVVAGAGVKVAKHGNYGVSSNCGSSNVLEALGIKFTNKEDKLRASIDKANICILHAPLFHPAMKTVAPIRKALKVKTFFNMLGPLVNPARPNLQSTGVFNMKLLRLYSYLLQAEKKQFAVIHDLEGYDEISLTGDTKIVTHNKDRIVSPSTFDLTLIQPKSIEGGSSIEDSAKIFINILNGHGTSAQEQVVCANAAIALSLTLNISFEKAIEKAIESLHSKKALASLNTLIQMN